MKKFNEFNRLNESSDPEQTLLENLFSFFYKKYSKVSISEVESNFVKSATKLVDGGEISREAFDIFLKGKGIDPNTVSTKTKSLRDTSGSMRQIDVAPLLSDDDDYSDCGTRPRRGNNTNWGSCGNSGGYSTSHC
jgi:hypothetical protein